MKFHQKTILIMLCSVLLCMSGCAGIGKTKEDVAKETLKNKYNEDFVVHEIDSFPDGFDATLSPVNNPEVLFIARMGNDGKDENDDYQKRYLAYQLNMILKNDLSCFFPKAYFKTDVEISIKDNQFDFRNSSLEGLILNTKEGEKTYREAHLYIYVDNSVKSTKAYEMEYKYFTETIDEYTSKNKTLPLVVKIYYVNSEYIDKISSYFQNDLDMDGYFEEEILGTTDYLKGVKKKGDEDLGNPPNIMINLKKDEAGYIGDEKEYIRRRELLETAP